MSAFLARFGHVCDHSHAQEVRLEKRSKERLISDIEALAHDLEAPLRDAIYALLAKLTDALDLERLEAAIKAGDMAAVLAVIDAIDLGAIPEQIEDGLRTVLWGAGLATAANINWQAKGATFLFGKLNPELINWLRTYQLGLIREITRETKEHIRDKLIQGMTAGQNPLTVAPSLKPGLTAGQATEPPLPGFPAKKAAQAVKEGIGLTKRQAQAVANFRRELETFHLRKDGAKGWGLGNKQSKVNGHAVWITDEDGTPTDGIEERRLRDFRFDRTLVKTLKSGTPLTPDQIDRMTMAYHRRYLQYRARTIARTEAIRTTNHGVQTAWEQAIAAGKVPESNVRRLWIVSKDERTCPTCSTVPKLNPKRGVRMDQPFKTSDGPVHLPPLHPNCRCTVFLRVWEPSQLQNE